MDKENEMDVFTRGSAYDEDYYLMDEYLPHQNRQVQ
jgi:hypothetical protein